MPPTAFGRFLRTQRKAVRLSQAELGKAIGVSGFFVSEVERGARAPIRPDRWPALAKALGVMIADLERAAAMTRPLEVDLSKAPPEQADLALALALRIREQSLSAE